MTFSLTEAKLAKGALPYHVGGSGAPLLCLHSAGGARLTSALERLAATRTLYLPVFPGFDGTPTQPHLRTMEDLAGLAAEFIDNVVGQPCDVMGHSFGGWVACWLAVDHPDRLQQLVLHAPAGFAPDGAPGLPTDLAKLRQLAFAHPENLLPDTRSLDIHRSNRETVDHYLGKKTNDRDLQGRLGDISALTLILHGTKDGLVPVASPRLLKERIRRSHLIYVHDAAHAIDVDQPARFVSLVEDFLAVGEAFIVNRSRDSAA
ncbi:MAG TPA: alpha/beta hydrolase [Stellaceae bacterium]|nr:alpha/beta hydrolase [Stellaceae bacterium]